MSVADVDLIIRNGMIFDGTGRNPFKGDIAVKGSDIVDVGNIPYSAADEIDASGKIVTPGFIDVHTHYDGQLIWSSEVSPSSSHGVTTVVTGNCGVGYAPCRPGDRDAMMELQDGVEDVPGAVMREGLTWEWETFPEFLAALQARPHDIDYAVQIPHAPLRIYVMGQRALDPEDNVATDEDMCEMRRLVKEAIEAGAVGFGTSRNIFHTSRDGTKIASYYARREELLQIAYGIKDAGRGVMQILLPPIGGLDVPEFKMFQEIAAETGVPFSYTIGQTKYEPDSWKELLDLTTKANEEGVAVKAQTFCRPTGILLGLNISYNPFSRFPTYQEIEHLPLAERVAEMRKPEVRARILADKPDDKGMNFHTFARDFQNIFPLGNPVNYEPDPEDCIEAVAARKGVSPFEVAYDLLLEDEGHAILFCASTNYEYRHLGPLQEMMSHPHAVMGLGDGGAHYAMICDSNYPTYLMSYWGRDRKAGTMPMPHIINLMTDRPAQMTGLTDRGRIAPSYRADINIIDLDALTLGQPMPKDDLPAGGRRIVQYATGYVATIVAGVPIIRNDKHTGNMPGTLARPVFDRETANVAA